MPEDIHYHNSKYLKRLTFHNNEQQPTWLMIQQFEGEPHAVFLVAGRRRGTAGKSAADFFVAGRVCIPPPYEHSL
jgi:hypothetical protein